MLSAGLSIGSQRAKRGVPWLAGQAISRTLSQASLFNDRQPVGEGVSEMRIHSGPGHRVKYMQHRANDGFQGQSDTHGSSAGSVAIDCPGTIAAISAVASGLP